MESNKVVKFTLEIDEIVHKLMKILSATHDVSMKDIVVRGIWKEIECMQKETNEKNTVEK